MVYVSVACYGYFLYSWQVVESETKLRWYSVLTAGQCSIVRSSTESNLKKNGLFLGNRYESTATASDTSASPPPEKYEYQAEVRCFFYKVNWVLISVVDGF